MGQTRILEVSLSDPHLGTSAFDFFGAAAVLEPSQQCTLGRHLRLGLQHRVFDPRRIDLGQQVAGLDRITFIPRAWR